MRRKVAIVMAAMLAASGPAQMPGPPGRKVEGKVAALTDTALTIAKPDGTIETVALLPNRTISITTPITVDQIRPGSFVATANKTRPDGSGVSIELRVFPPESPPGLVNRVMSDADQLVMTNGRVARVVNAEGGRRLTVDYGTGTRQITVPGNIVMIFSITPGTPALLKPGIKVTVTTVPPMGERPARQTIMLARAGLGG